MTNFTKLFFTCILFFSTCTIIAEPPPTTEEQMTSLQDMCAQSTEARAERHATKSLYGRLGGYDKIMTLSKEIIQLHLQNDQIKHMLDGVDLDKLAGHLTDFVSAGTGGTAEYKGRSMPASHAHLNLKDSDFLSAGGDIIKSMQNLGYGQNEIDEFVCILVSLKDQVVYK